MFWASSPPRYKFLKLEMVNPSICLFFDSIKNQPPPVNNDELDHLANWSRQLRTASCFSTKLAKTAARVYSDRQDRNGLSPYAITWSINSIESESYQIPSKTEDQPHCYFLIIWIWSNKLKFQNTGRISVHCCETCFCLQTLRLWASLGGSSGSAWPHGLSQHFQALPSWQMRINYKHVCENTVSRNWTKFWKFSQRAFWPIPILI